MPSRRQLERKQNRRSQIQEAQEMNEPTPEELAHINEAIKKCPRKFDPFAALQKPSNQICVSCNYQPILVSFCGVYHDFQHWH